MLEPTCGEGSFLLAAARAFPEAEVIGVERAREHVIAARRAIDGAGLSGRAAVIEADLFTLDWSELIPRDRSPLLVVGNPPWVTAAEMARIGGHNLPLKSNFRALRGVDAITGASNFDISEAVLLAALHHLQARAAVVAMLCKLAVARRVLTYAAERRLPLEPIGLWRVDARRNFGAAVDAGLFVFRTDGAGDRWTCPVVEVDRRQGRAFGLVDSVPVADFERYQRWQAYVGADQLRWRSGVKHDCAAVMELTGPDPGTLHNRLGERLSLEPDHLYPLVKTADLRRGRVDGGRWLLVPQQRVGEPTEGLTQRAPKTWSYLERHRARFDRRASTVYRGKPPFSIFGVGPYSFAPWKVAVSGLDQGARFLLLGPRGGRPVMLDDTCYFLGFDDERLARAALAVMTSAPASELLSAMMFPDAKRPLTLALLKRLHLGRLTSALARSKGLEREDAERLIHLAGDG